MDLERTTLSEPLSRDLRKEIVSRFWQKSKANCQIEEYSPYFRFYEKSCEALYLGIRSEVASLFADSHQHLLDIVDAIWGYIDSSQPCIRPNLQRKLAEHFNCELSDETREQLTNSINLALRLWLTLDIREDVFAPATSTIQWNDVSTLQEFIKQQFPSPRLSSRSEKERIILGSDFTAVNLRRFGGINIDWTYSLNEHLLFDRESRKVKVYTLKTCLYDQKSSKTEIIPNALLDETIRTLGLLFPDGDPQTSKFLRSMNQHDLAETDTDPARVYLSDFHYWQDRLSEICFEYQSPPSTWRQIWTDRRNRLQWYTFWLAVAIFFMTAVFGLISTVATCLQTKYSYQSYVLARDAAASSAAASLRRN